MCVSLKYQDQWLFQLGQARKAFGDALALEDDYAHPLPDDSCLCPVDYEQTAKNLGMQARQSESDAMAYEIAA